MKKLLFLLLSAAVAISASAGISQQTLTRVPTTLKMSKMDKLQKKSVNYGIIQTHQLDLNQRFLAPLRAASDLITEQPEGELKTYTRSGSATYYSNQTIYWADQSGTVDIVYVGDGTVYVKDPISYIAVGTWVKGTIDGNKLSIPVGQFITWNSTYNYGLILAFGTFDTDEEGYVHYVNDDNVTEVTFTINGPTITLDNTTCDEDAFAMTGFTAIWDDDLSWQGYMDAETVWQEQLSIDVNNLAVEPGSTTADVTWDVDEDAEGYDLRYRPYVDTSGNPIDCHFTMDGYEADLELGWSVLDADGDGEVWGVTSNPNDNTDACLYSDSYYNGTGLTPDNWLISPLTKLQGVCKFKIAHRSSYPEILEVMIGMEDAIDGDMVSTSDFTTIATFTTEGNAFVEKTVDLSAYAGAKGYVVFRHYGTTDQWRLYLDDIFIGDPNAEVVEPYEWIYIPALETNECNIPGLTPETTYEIQGMGYNGDLEGDWCESVIFTTLPEAVIPDVYMLGGDDQQWNPAVGTKFDYNAEDNVYTATVTFPAEHNYFAFTTKLAENAGDWDAIAPYRFGAVSNGNFDWNMGFNGMPLDLTWGGEAYHIAGGEYNITVDLENMKVIIEAVVAPHDYAPGDVNHSGNVNIEDVTALIDFLLGSGEACEICADVDGENGVNIEDVTSLIDKLLAGASK